MIEDDLLTRLLGYLVEIESLSLVLFIVQGTTGDK